MRQDFPANPIARPGYTLEFHDDFTTPELDTGKWIAAHLPQWSSAERAAARWRIEDQQLVLRIDADQPAWCPEYDGGIRVSSLQTGVFSGPVGSQVGQHRFNKSSVVREAQASRALYTPTYGYFEMRAKGVDVPGYHVALWMIGYEDSPERSSEICICEIFGKHAGGSTSKVGMGVHPFQDPAIVDDFEEVELPIDVTTFHVYAAEWAPTHVDFFVDNIHLRRVNQSPAYPMQLMLGIYERPAERRADAPGDGHFPVRFVVDYVRGYRREAWRIKA